MNDPLTRVEDIVRVYLHQKRTFFARRTYRSDRAVLLRFLAATSVGPVEDLTLDLATRYVWRRLQDPGRLAERIAPATVNVEIRTLKAFCAWCVEHGHMEEHPLRKLRQIKVAQPGEPPFLTLDEIKAILGDLREPIPGRRGASRVYDLVQLAILTGLRKSELFRLRWEDMDLERGRLRVAAEEKSTGHNQKVWRERWIPIGRRVLAVLPTQNASPWVFPGRGGAARCKTSNSVNMALQKAAKRTGIDRRVTLQVMRHSYASHLRMAGVDLEVVGQLLGHSSPETTRIYQHLDQEWIREEARKLPIQPPGKISDSSEKIIDSAISADYSTGAMAVKTKKSAKKINLTIRLDEEIVRHLDRLARMIGNKRHPVAQALLMKAISEVLEKRTDKTQRDAVLEALTGVIDREVVSR